MVQEQEKKVRVPRLFVPQRVVMREAVGWLTSLVGMLLIPAGGLVDIPAVTLVGMSAVLVGAVVVVWCNR